MAQLMEYAEYLTQEIGPRPAGTEEEQQAALYITERFQKDAGFSAQLEEFASSSNLEGMPAIPCLIIIIVAILAMIFPMLSIPAFILAAASAALYTLEAFGHPIVTKALARGASQNVVAKYQPGSEEQRQARGRSRKIVLVAHYDSGKVTPSLVRSVESMRLPVPIDFICACGTIAAAFFLLLHIFVNNGIGAIILNVLTILSLILCAYPALRSILLRMAPYNEGANNNASGTAALLEVARRISRGSVSEADLQEDPEAAGITIHGEEAARERGLVPEGVQIRYEAERLIPPSELGEYDDEERLLAAKAAIAALTGQPVERKVYGSVANNLVNSRAQEPMYEEEPPVAEAAPAMEAVGGQVPLQPAAQSTFPEVPPMSTTTSPVLPSYEYKTEADVEGFENAPSWFISAQRNAKRPTEETGPIQRSRYAEAIEAAEREAAEREREREEQERAQREAELRAREEAARAAYAASQPAAEEQPVYVEEPAEDEPAMSLPEVQVQPEPEKPAAQAALEDLPTPVFVPFEEAFADEMPKKKAPAKDEYAESLGSTIAFDPRTMQDAGLTEPEEAVDPEQNERARQRANRLAGLPSIEQGVESVEPSNDANPSRSSMFRKLRADVPSLSSPIDVKPVEDALQAVPDPAPAVNDAPAPERGPVQEFATVAIDYVEEAAQEPVEDWEDDRDYDEMEEVEVPKSRAGGFFSRFRRNKRERLEETPQEWLDVDDDFDARTVGAERGGWESFRSDDYDDYDDYDDGRSNRRWEGGAFSRVRLGRVDTRSGEESDADKPAVVEEVEDLEQEQIVEEIEQIYHFRNPLYNTEIWFVALGSENDAHDGTRAFMADHADELRGAMIIEIESLGVGDLSYATEEGRVRTMAASSRVKRYMKDAVAATGINPLGTSLAGQEGAASLLQASGYQTMHLFGVEDGIPALKGSADDVLENVDELVLDDHVNFLMELLKK